MKKIGIDLGTSTVKLALIGTEGPQVWCAPHHGQVTQTLLDGLRSMELPEKIAVCVTGSNRHAVLMQKLLKWADRRQQC